MRDQFLDEIRVLQLWNEFFFYFVCEGRRSPRQGVPMERVGSPLVRVLVREREAIVDRSDPDFLLFSFELNQPVVVVSVGVANYVVEEYHSLELVQETLHQRRTQLLRLVPEFFNRGARTHVAVHKRLERAYFFNIVEVFSDALHCGDFWTIVGKVVERRIGQINDL